MRDTFTAILFGLHRWNGDRAVNIVLRQNRYKIGVLDGTAAQRMMKDQVPAWAGIRGRIMRRALAGYRASTRFGPDGPTGFGRALRGGGCIEMRFPPGPKAGLVED